MARYEHLPIFKNAYALAFELDKRVHDFSRYHKYSIGAELRESSRNVLRLVVQANNQAERVTVLQQLRWQVEFLKVMIRLAYESGAFPNGKKSYLFLSEKAVEVARQNEGWLKHLSKEKPEVV